MSAKIVWSCSVFISVKGYAVYLTTLTHSVGPPRCMSVLLGGNNFAVMGENIV